MVKILKDFEKENIEFIPPKDVRQTPYLFDSSIRKGYCDAVIIPKTEEELIKTVKIAIKHKTQITTRGLGTNTNSSALPFGGILISTTKLNKIKILKEDSFIETEPGAITSQIKELADKNNLYYPPDPASYKFSTIGGNIALNSGGASTLKYGTTRDYVKKIKIIDGTGKIHIFGEKTHKYSSGYFLPSLFCGSEGTLGIILKAWLKLIPKPTHFKYYAIKNPDFSKFSKLRQFPFFNMEYLDILSGSIINKKKEAWLLLAIDANSKQILTATAKETEQLFKQLNLKYKASFDKSEIWNIRKQLSPLSYKYGKIKLSQDIVLPLSKIEQMLKKIEELQKQNQQIKIFSFGHIGDGNIHINIMTNKKNIKTAKEVRNHIFETLKKLNGMLSGEHGIGIDRKEFLPHFIPYQEIEIFKQIKQIFDPNNLMNKGKIF
jgi:FAD/FMN-containing dehydrogenase